MIDAYRDLEYRFDVVVCEGAGSPAEINLRHSDIVNLGFARAAPVFPAVLVGDIDPGGVFAAFSGTLALLSGQDQDLIHGMVVNRFRGDVSLLQPGLDMMEALTGRPTYGVIPYVRGLGMDAEDAIDLASSLDPTPPIGRDVLRVAVVRFPRASNLTDFDALAAEPGLIVRFITRPEEATDADLVVLPGTRTTVSDLSWLRNRGFESNSQGSGRCRSTDPRYLWRLPDARRENRRSDRERWGHFGGPGTAAGSRRLRGRESPRPPPRHAGGRHRRNRIEIHHGRVTVEGGTFFFADQGCRQGSVAGTTWHGLFENDLFRRSYLSEVADLSGRDYVPSSNLVFDHVARHADQHARRPDGKSPRHDGVARRAGGSCPHAAPSIPLSSLVLTVCLPETTPASHHQTIFIGGGPAFASAS